MKSYLRFLSRNKLYTAIEVVGLSVSLAFVIVTGNFVWESCTITWDIPDHEDIFVLSGLTEFHSGPEMETHIDEIPHIKQHCMYQYVGASHKSGDEVSYKYLGGVCDEFLEMFPQRFIAGNKSAIVQNHGIIITESFSAGISDTPEGAVGKFVEFDFGDGFISIPVRGVIENFTNSIFADLDAIISSDSPEFNNRNAYGGCQIFVKTEKETTQSELSENVHELIKRHFPKIEEQYVRYGMNHDFAHHLDDIYLKHRKNGLKGGQAQEIIRTMLFICLVMLISSILNYINLSYAQVSKRGAELATMQLLGAGKGRLILRMMAESISLTALCGIFAFLLTETFLPGINSIISNSYPIILDVTVESVTITILAVLIIGVIAAIIPTSLSLSYKPIDVTRGVFRRKKRTFEIIFICIQTSLAVILTSVACCLEASRIQSVKAPFGVSNTDICFILPEEFREIRPGLLEERLKKLPVVKAIGHSNGILNTDNYEKISRPDGKQIMIYVMTCDVSAFNSLGFDKISDLHTELDGSVWFSRELLESYDIDINDISSIDTDEMLPSHPSLHLGGAIEELCISPHLNIEINGGIVIVDNDIKDARWILIDTYGNRDEALKAIEEECISVEKNELGHMRRRSQYFHTMDSFRKVFNRDLNRTLWLVRLFSVLSVMLSMLGMIGMSTYYAHENTREIAIRKIFGGTIISEVSRNISTYMLLTVTSCLIGIPIGYMIVNKYLSHYLSKLDGIIWLYATAAVILLLSSLLSVLWQTIRAARTNPAEALRKE